MTESNDERVEILEAEIAELKAHVKEQNERQAVIRRQRNDERKKTHAMRAVLAAHNVNFDVSEADLSNLEIDKNDGSVVGEFHYEVPEIKPDLPRASGKAETLTLDDLDGMSADQINARWDEVLELSKAGAIN